MPLKPTPQKIDSSPKQQQANSTGGRKLTTIVDKIEGSNHVLIHNMSADDLLRIENLHRQYLDHRINDNLNIIADEIKNVYCQDLDIRTYQTLLLAQANGLLAARALGLGTCERIESSGLALSLQKCTMETIVLKAKKTQCGYQPFYETPFNVSYTLGKDGWSLHPFMDCFWTGPYVSINDKIYTYVNGKWRIEKPVIHLNKLHLINKFEELPANELDFATIHHSAFDTHSLEQLNVFSELLSRVQESNSESLSDLVMDVQSKNDMWDLTGWMKHIKYGLLAFVCLIVAIIILTILIKFRAAIASGLRNRFPRNLRNNTDAPETMIPMMQREPSASAPPPFTHDHTDTVFVNGKLYWKDMCPIQPLGN